MQQKHVHNVAILVNKALTLLMQLKYYIELKVSFKKIIYLLGVGSGLLAKTFQDLNEFSSGGVGNDYLAKVGNESLAKLAFEIITKL